MNKTKAALLFLGLAALGLVINFVFFTNRASDTEMIRTALEEAIQASKEGRSGGVLDLLSREFEVNTGRFTNTRDIARQVRDMKPKVEIENWEPIIRGDSATLVTAVTLSLSGPLKFSMRVPEVRMEFQKEDTMNWLVIPTKKWKLRRVRVDEDVIRQLAP
jgi:hypothetical protein